MVDVIPILDRPRTPKGANVKFGQDDRANKNMIGWLR